MYVIVLEVMEHFKAGKKGILLTNTRHSYKGIKQKNGQYFWDTGTFFAQWHPGKTYSIRLHNVALSIRAIKPVDPEDVTDSARDGASRLQVCADGSWPVGHRVSANGDRPVAIPLAHNVFGQEPYIGNHQPEALPNQKIEDAYDALIFLAPLEKLRQTAQVDFIYTPAFRQELKRRFRLEHSEAELAEMLKGARTRRTSTIGLPRRSSPRRNSRWNWPKRSARSTSGSSRCGNKAVRPRSTPAPWRYLAR